MKLYYVQIVRDNAVKFVPNHVVAASDELSAVKSRLEKMKSESFLRLFRRCNFPNVAEQYPVYARVADVYGKKWSNGMPLKTTTYTLGL